MRSLKKLPKTICFNAGVTEESYKAAIDYDKAENELDRIVWEVLATKNPTAVLLLCKFTGFRMQ